MEPLDRDEFVAACRIAHELASRQEVAAAWHLESACAGMTVGGLTHHLLAQVRHVTTLLSLPPAREAPISLLDHYARAAWVSAEPHDEANTSIRDEGNSAAHAGPETVLSEIEPLIRQLPAALGATRAPDTVLIPWQGWSLNTDDFLVTRAMELVVHSDDLAASIDAEPVVFPAGVAEHIVQLLAGVALRRRGQSALVRALSRPQRAPATISAF
ncbi:maleylpyruvate isomerase N-terminal domain-containing protein [Aeromicrobium wangtongii]|uniref:maleylpyruvate isomerase N-terminal domain-containing protein n=1 Tax=Aeromicrobium wangtongii TaxID=2969247 RepID=UPI0020174F22|nr:maleylpyruvate isomerase N-terminal domain-containing protein [Aeromicrobium wangtongii]MCL3817920.1 maleylpyruvate isomerase N-terminal domain-containing protein [Aeromicrobium wangtongii]